MPHSAELDNKKIQFPSIFRDFLNSGIVIVSILASQQAGCLIYVGSLWILLPPFIFLSVGAELEFVPVLLY